MQTTTTPATLESAAEQAAERLRPTRSPRSTGKSGGLAATDRRQRKALLELSTPGACSSIAPTICEGPACRDGFVLDTAVGSTQHFSPVHTDRTETRFRHRNDAVKPRRRSLTEPRQLTGDAQPEQHEVSGGWLTPAHGKVRVGLHPVLSMPVRTGPSSVRSI